MTLIFSIHYFLWYGALTSIFGYEMVYARRYTNSTTIQFGYLNMILPFVTVLVTPLICSIADRNRNHRTYFTISLILTFIALCLYALLPIVITNSNQQIDLRYNRDSKNELQLGSWIFFCLISLLSNIAMGVNTCLSDSFAILQAEERGMSFGRVIVWGTFGWASTALALCLISQINFLPRLVPGIIFGAILLAVDVIIVSFWKKNSDFKLDFIPASAAQTLTGSASTSHKDPSDYMSESAQINLGTELNEKDGTRLRHTKSAVELILEDAIQRKISVSNAQEETAQQQQQQVSIEEQQKKQQPILVESSPLSSSIKTINSDLGTERTVSSGYSRLDHQQLRESDKVTGLGEQQGSGSLITQKDFQINTLTIKSNNNNNKDVSKEELFRNVNINNEQQRNFASFKMQLLLFSMILRKRHSLIRYLILFISSGFFMSMHWNYFFLYLEEIYRSKFELISALSMVCQSLLGELPFFILSRKFIYSFGRSHTLSISIISIGLRFLLYRFFLPNVSMYLIIIADCFQGPNYGLFYVVMTEIGLEYSFCDDDTIEQLAAQGKLNRNNTLEVDTIRLSLRSTVQSVAFACYEGLGVGLGSIVGGWIVHSYGFNTLWLTMSIGAILVGSLNLLLELIWSDEDDSVLEKSERQEFMEARRRGTLEKVSRPRPFPAPVPLSAFKFQQPPGAKLKMMIVQKQVNNHLAPPAAVASKH